MTNQQIEKKLNEIDKKFDEFSLFISKRVGDLEQALKILMNALAVKCIHCGQPADHMHRIFEHGLYQDVWSCPNCHKIV
jgi:hypothetical protein